MNQPHDPTNPAPDDTAWEEAMSRDFDARVRDLHEAPLDIGSVKGKAHQIKRNRRAAVAGGILGVAAVVTPIAVLANGDGDSRSRDLDVAETSETTAADPSSGIDYLLDGTWHQADGDKVDLPDSDHSYDSAVLWDGNLAATRWDGEVYSVSVVVAEDGTLLDTLETTGPVVVNDAGTTAAWVDTAGQVVVSTGSNDEVVIGNVDLAAPGEAVAWTATAVGGGPSCLDDTGGCTVFVDSNLGNESRAFSSLGGDETVAPAVTKVFDAGDGAVSVRTQTTEYLDTCGGLLDLVDGTLRWETCDYQVHQISPDGQYVAAPQTQYDGLGPSSLSVLDAATGEETGRYGVEGGFIGTWAWATDGQLLFDAYDGAKWHLFSMTPDGGQITEIGEPVKGDEFSPYTLIQR